jgi:hypothetical protein
MPCTDLTKKCLELDVMFSEKDTAMSKSTRLWPMTHRNIYYTYQPKSPYDANHISVWITE